MRRPQPSASAGSFAAFHLDRLVDGGLLATEYRRLSGRTGPGAGRPAKLYRRADREFAVSLPDRRYERAAGLMATALVRLGDDTGAATLAAVAREQGVRVGASARLGPDAIELETATERRPGALGTLLDVLGGAGYEPRVEPDGTVCLGNCPYRAIAAVHRDITCGMNLAWAEGVVHGLEASDVTVELAPAPGRCCVIFHAEPVPDPV